MTVGFIWNKISDIEVDIDALRGLGGDKEDIEFKIEELEKDVKEIKTKLEAK